VFIGFEMHSIFFPLNSINRFVLVMDIHCSYCKVGTESMYIS